MVQEMQEPERIDSQREKSERFEVAFNQIHDEIRNLVKFHDNDHFIELLHQARNEHSSIRRHFDDLKSFARLRNALIHEKSRRDFYIAEPHLEVVEQIESIAAFLKTPPSILTIASNKVKTYESQDEIKDILVDMQNYSFTQFPIYHENRFSFLLTERGMRSYFAGRLKGNVIDLSGQKLCDIKPFENTNTVKFVSKKMNIFELEDLFEERVQRKDKLEAVIITETGSEKEMPIGIISPWDLIKTENR
jgi:predicted transcriptional regulator